WQGEDWKGVDLTNARVTNHISSNHSGGTTACFADGHVQQLSDVMSYNTYQALMTPNGLKYRKDNSDKPVEREVSSKDY
ncbi:MAG: H-X9-DG-CTERM domain-containing protein, partial [Patescibacteria group bacterium]|nr:H-X9-DG-CTERM domain-containing protein [Patescibacteria group bacterium]